MTLEELMKTTMAVVQIRNRRLIWSHDWHAWQVWSEATKLYEGSDLFAAIEVLKGEAK